MAQVKFAYETFALPDFAAEPFSAEKLIPGGGRVVADDFTADGDGRKPIDAGTLVGRTFAERTAGTGFSTADVANDDEIYLLAFTVQDATENADCALLRHATLIYEDKLPGWAGLTAAQQSAIRSRYHCIASAA